jgi:lipocalin
MPEKVNIKLDHPSGVYFAGETVSGKVKIEDNSRNGTFRVSFLRPTSDINYSLQKLKNAI